MSNSDGAVSSAWPRLVLFSCLYLTISAVFLVTDKYWPIGRALWPYTGLGVAGLLLFGLRIWPLVFLLNLGSNLLALPVANAVGESSAELVGICLAAGLLLRFGFEPSFRRLRDAVAILAAAAFGPIAGAGLKQSVFYLTHGTTVRGFFSNWFNWWRGDSLGVVILTPLVVIWFFSPKWQEIRRGWLEPLLLAVSVAVLSFAILTLPKSVSSSHSPILNLFFLLAFWAAMRFGVRGSVTLVGIATAVIVLETFRLSGSLIGNSSLPEMWGLLVCLSTSSLLMATAIEERAAAETERRRSERSRRLLEEKFSLAFFNSNECIGMTRLPESRIVDVNDALVNFFGAPREELIGRTIPEIGAFADPSDRERFLADAAVKPFIYDRKVQARRKSGEVRTISLTGGIVQDERDRYVIYRFHDITEESAAAEELRKSEQKYRDLFENANDFIFTVDAIGNFRSANLRGEAILGIPRSELERSNLIDLTLPEHRGLLRQTMLNLVGQKSSSVIEVNAQRRPEGVVTLELALRSVFQDGAAEIQGVARDVTDRRLLEAQFRQVQKMEALGSLAGGVAHDFNNLLTVIKGYSVLAGDIAGESPKLREAFTEIGRAADRGAGLTSQLLAFGRQQIARKTVFCADDAIAGIKKMLMRVMSDDISLTVNPGAARATVECDQTQFDQVLLNLAVNARDAMPSGGKLEFSSQRLVLRNEGSRDVSLPAGEYVLISVSDTGCGMDAKTMNRIFEPFFTTKPAGKGTGLGLSTVYGIMKQSGGHVAVSSELGKGTTFRLYFPVAKTSSASVLQEVQRVNARGSETIMLVDDDSALRNLSARVLEGMGYRVMCAAGIDEAQQLLFEFGGDIHLVVTDVVMPGGGGELLVEQLGKLRPKTGVLFMSGYTDGRIPEKYLTGSHPAFLSKPFTPNQLAEKVREMLDAGKA